MGRIAHGRQWSSYDAIAAVESDFSEIRTGNSGKFLGESQGGQ
jgi:hypothetical protein